MNTDTVKPRGHWRTPSVLRWQRVLFAVAGVSAIVALTLIIPAIDRAIGIVLVVIALYAASIAIYLGAAGGPRLLGALSRIGVVTLVGAGYSTAVLVWSRGPLTGFVYDALGIQDALTLFFAAQVIAVFAVRVVIVVERSGDVPRGLTIGALGATAVLTALCVIAVLNPGFWGTPQLGIGLVAALVLDVAATIAVIVAARRSSRAVRGASTVAR